VDISHKPEQPLNMNRGRGNRLRVRYMSCADQELMEASMKESVFKLGKLIATAEELGDSYQIIAQEHLT
jgi:hypothetical protein